MGTPIGRNQDKGGETALGTTGLFSRAAKHTQCPVGNEKAAPPSWEHQPPGLPPSPALGRAEMDVWATLSARKDLWQELIHSAPQCSGVRRPGLNPAQHLQAGQTPCTLYGTVRSSLGLIFPTCDMGVIVRVLVTTQLNKD